MGKLVMKLKIFSLFFLLSFFEIAVAEKIYTSDKRSYSIETVVDGLQYPWAVEFITDKKILITERPGYLRIYENGKLSTPIKGLPSVKAERQGGLLDVVLDPDFNKNKIIFFSYSAGNMFGIGGITVVSSSMYSIKA